jgi:ubiquinone/menaquinone biosynthesis C-methylase UbiE
MHKFDPEHTQMLVSEERRSKIQPEIVLRDAGLKDGDVFADIGCGPGFFTMPASAIVGPSGKVYAIDTEIKMLKELEKGALPVNVVPVRSEENKIPLGSEAIDFALLAYVLHETEDKVLFLREIMRILKKDGVFLVLDWKKKKEDEGPPIEERLSERDVVRLLRDAGFGHVMATDLNESHYRVLCSKGL